MTLDGNNDDESNGCQCVQLLDIAPEVLFWPDTNYPVTATAILIAHGQHHYQIIIQSQDITGHLLAMLRGYLQISSKYWLFLALCWEEKL